MNTSTVTKSKPTIVESYLQSGEQFNWGMFLRLQIEHLIGIGYVDALHTWPEPFRARLLCLKKQGISNSIFPMVQAHSRTIPFLVIPCFAIDLEEQMRMVELNGQTGYIDSSINPEGLGRNTGSVPESALEYGAYPIFWVKTGDGNVEFPLHDSVKLFKKVGRWGLNLREGIALVTYFPRLLEHHAVYLVRSLFQLPRTDEKLIPVIELDEHRCPRLTAYWRDDVAKTNQKYGVPSQARYHDHE